MSDQEQDHINSFFQRSLKGEPSGYLEDDWLKMERLLNRERRRRPIFYWWKQFGGVRLLALTMLLCFGIIYLSTRQTRPADNNDGTSAGVKAGALNTQQPEATTLSRKLSTQDYYADDKPENITHAKPSDLSADLSKQPAGSDFDQPHFRLNHPLSSVRTHDIFVNGIDTRAKKVPGTLETGTSAIERVYNGNRTVPGGFFASKIPYRNSKIGLGLQPSVVPELNVTSPQLPGNFKSRWSLGIVASPELNSPEFSGPYKLGATFGGTLRFRFAERWFIAAGVNAGRKNYTGAGSQYHPPKGYWNYRTNGVVPDRVTGYCQMLEIPLELQYLVLKKQSDQLLAGLGMTSYIMRAESYSYSFKNPNPGSETGWNSAKSELYPFKVIRGSMNFEHQFSSRVSLGATPYIQVPLKGVGWTNIRLTSIGSSFILRYHF